MCDERKGKVLVRAPHWICAGSKNSGAPIRLQYYQLNAFLDVCYSASTNKRHSTFSQATRNVKPPTTNPQQHREMELTIRRLVIEVFQEMGWFSVKPVQQEVVRAIMNRDVFVILPTGFEECLLL